MLDSVSVDLVKGLFFTTLPVQVAFLWSTMSVTEAAGQDLISDFSCAVPSYNKGSPRLQLDD